MKISKSNKEKEIKKAVALRYKPGDNAPVVVAKGKGKIAEKIIEKAIEEDIYIYQDDELVNSLIDLHIYEEIPEELYEVLAEIIFYVYELDRQRGR
ncbi:MAG TPA: EscU/YscU/HrcU family type III secretion system export apparatus switch protein [Tissierellaceae bacterium]